MGKKDKKVEEVEEEEVQEEPSTPIEEPEERFIVYRKGGAKFWQYPDGRLEVCE